VYICDATPGIVTPWRQTVSRAIARAIASPRRTRARVMGEARCGANKVEFACSAGVYDKGGRTLICSADTLLLLMRVSAWYALKHGEAAGESYEAFRNRQPQPLGLGAFRSAAPGKGDTAFESSVEALRREVEAGGDQGPGSATAKVFQAVLGMTFAAIFGHEASHLEEGPPFCAIAEQSRVEESALWTVLLRVNASDELYKRNDAVREEVVADRCATRRIRYERASLQSGTLSANDQEFVRRAAADIISSLLLSHTDAPSGRPAFVMDRAYLYPPMRIMALAGEMNAGAPGPMVCGGAAESLVEAAQQTYKAQPGNGMMPDDMEHTLPKGVIDAWSNRGAWSPAAFACR
jgi:hypothetical protein